MGVRFGECDIDVEARTLRHRGAEVHLTRKAFDLLALLLRRRPEVVTKEAIVEELWPDTFVTEGNLSNLVAEIRRALKDDAREPRYVRTVHRVGYALHSEAEPSAQTARAATRWRLSGPLGQFDLRSGENVLGRSADCAVALADPSVSRRHARIHVDAGGLAIEDLDSSNGTFVEGTRLTGRVALRHGSAVRVGLVALTVVEVDPSRSTERVSAIVRGGRPRAGGSDHT